MRLRDVRDTGGSLGVDQRRKERDDSKQKNEEKNKTRVLRGGGGRVWCGGVRTVFRGHKVAEGGGQGTCEGVPIGSSGNWRQREGARTFFLRRWANTTLPSAHRIVRSAHNSAHAHASASALWFWLYALFCRSRKHGGRFVYGWCVGKRVMHTAGPQTSGDGGKNVLFLIPRHGARRALSHLPKK